MKTAAEFWVQVDRGPAAVCWPWRAGRKSQGYGTLRWRGPVVSAHRIAWEIVNGPIPSGLLVLHSCDNPPCCNPAHLFLGTIADNNHDCQAKGRRPVMRGSTNGNARLTDVQVRAIVGLWATGRWKQRDLATRFGVSQRAVWGYIHGVLRGADAVTVS